MKITAMFPVVILLVFGTAWAQKPVDKAGLLQDPEWKKIYDDYVPAADAIVRLRDKAAGLKADVYFAFWCSDSLNHVPVFLKILDAAAPPGFSVVFYEVERKTDPEQKYYVEEMLVEKVPTFIFYAVGGELGRIVENPANSILEDMLLIAAGGEN